MKRIRPFSLFIVLVVVGGLVYLQQTSNNDNSDMVKETTVKSKVYIDVRTAEEWEAGHLSNAIHLDLEKIKQGQMPDLPKETELLLYCRTGRRAEEAKAILLANGFTNVKNIGGLAELGSSVKICYGKEASCY